MKNKIYKSDSNLFMLIKVFLYKVATFILTLIKQNI